MNVVSAIKPGQPVGGALRDIAAGAVAEAQAILNDPALDSTTKVHDIRRALKRWRALLRMLEPHLGEGGAALRLQARDLARRLTVARDAQSAIDAFHDTIAGTYDLPPTLSPQNLVAIYRRLEELRADKEAKIWDEETRQQFSDYIAAASYYVSHWALHPLTFSDLASRLAETYRRARQALPKDWSAATPPSARPSRRSRSE